MRFFALLATLALAADMSPSALRRGTLLTLEDTNAALQQLAHMEPLTKASNILFMIDQPGTPETLRLFLNECKDVEEVKAMFAEGSKVQLPDNVLFMEWLIVKGYMNELFKAGRFDMLKVFRESGLLNDDSITFDTVNFPLDAIIFLLENNMNAKHANRYTFHYMRLPTSTAADLQSLHQAGFSMAHVETDAYGQGMLENLMQVGNIDAAYYAYQNGSKLVRSRFEQGWYDNFNAIPEDLCSHIIEKEFKDSAVLFLMAMGDEENLMSEMPVEMSKEHIAPALFSAIYRNTFDSLFYLSL